MSMKLQPSTRVYNKNSKTSTVKHYFASTYSMKSLLEMLDNPKIKPKLRAKVEKEVAKRQAIKK